MTKKFLNLSRGLPGHAAKYGKESKYRGVSGRNDLVDEIVDNINAKLQHQLFGLDSPDVVVGVDMLPNAVVYVE
ncbi:MAG: hypothetical protein P4M07_15700 [Xanthobacteraceae bacterium]|nr:hypothetical protein [Xanthobacteraceae bacterium]